jgi:hypothetical protein
VLAVGTRVAQLWPDFFETGVNSRYPWKLKKPARRETADIFHLLDCPIGFQGERHEPIGQGGSGKK